jgi:hypothetical protein
MTGQFYEEMSIQQIFEIPSVHKIFFEALSGRKRQIFGVPFL